VRDEKITVAYAEREYGVVIDSHTLQLDEVRTAALRQARDGYADGERVTTPDAVRVGTTPLPSVSQ
jgi:hypothetical protein